MAKISNLKNFICIIWTEYWYLWSKFLVFRGLKNPSVPKCSKIKLVQKGPQKAIFSEKSELKFRKISEHGKKTSEIKQFCLINLLVPINLTKTTLSVAGSIPDVGKFFSYFYDLKSTFFVIFFFKYRYLMVQRKSV